MRTWRKFVPFVVGVLLITIAASPVPIPQQASDNPSAPEETVKLIFIHHSTGQNWLADDYGNLGKTLGQNNYFVSDTNYGWGPNAIGDRTDIPNWMEWFASEDTPTYMSALFSENGQHSSYTRTLSNPGGENEIIMFKSCFPNSALEGNPYDPPDPDGWLTVGHAKYVYNQILQYFATRPDKMFVVITAPPLRDATYAANARAFNQWLMNDWLNENNYSLNNVFVFDFYNVLTGPNAHHRYYNGQIEHTLGSQDTLYYPSGDDHPSAAGSQKATDEFVPLLNVFYHRWKENPLGTGIYDDALTSWVYNGNFVSFASPNAYHGGIHYTTTVGNYAEFTFIGSQVSLLYTGNTNRGKVDVFLDSNPTKLVTVNEYTASAVYQKKWTSGDLGAGPHTIRLVHAGPAGKTINIDAIEVGDYVPPVAPGTGTYDDADANWIYTGSFVTFASTSAYQGGIRYTTTVGNSAEFTFTGSQISILYTGNTNRGKVDVFLDDNPTKIATFNEYTATAVFQKKWTSGDLGAGTHTIKLVHAGTAGKMINLDAIEVETYQAPGAGTYDDTHAGWKYTGSFVTFASSSAYQGGIHYTTTVGDSAEFTFTGSQIILVYTGNTNRGKVEVYVDGNPTKVATIDEYTASAVFQQHSVAITVGAGTHTVKLVHAGPAGTTSNLDAMEVLP